jgi:Zn-dependent protease
VLLAITLHEAAHAYAAKRFGDSTAYMLGRMTLNPLKHIDPVGTVLLPLLSLMMGGVLFGWAKPVPVNFGALRNPRSACAGWLRPGRCPTSSWRWCGCCCSSWPSSWTTAIPSRWR